VSGDLLDKKTAVKTNMQHINLQYGLFATFNRKHFIGGVGRSNEKNLSNDAA